MKKITALLMVCIMLLSGGMSLLRAEAATGTEAASGSAVTTEKSVAPSTSAEPPAPATSPKTGDNNVLLILVISVAALMTVFFVRKIREK